MNLTEITWMICAVLFGGSAVWALCWSVRAGQLDDFNGAAKSIFDEDEPIGLRTDRFPTGSEKELR